MRTLVPFSRILRATLRPLRSLKTPSSAGLRAVVTTSLLLPASLWAADDYLYACQIIAKPRQVAGHALRIEADTIILSSGELRLIAPVVSLRPGFEVEKGGELEIYSQNPCPNCNSPSEETFTPPLSPQNIRILGDTDE